MVRWEGRVITFLNLLAEGEEVHLVPIKWTLECCHLEKEEESLDKRISWEEKERSSSVSVRNEHWKQKLFRTSTGTIQCPVIIDPD